MVARERCGISFAAGLDKRTETGKDAQHILRARILVQVARGVTEEKVDLRLGTRDDPRDAQPQAAGQQAIEQQASAVVRLRPPGVGGYHEGQGMNQMRRVAAQTAARE